MLRYFLYKIARWIIRVFPLRVSFALARFLSDCQHAFSVKDRRAVRSNIASLEADPRRVNSLTREVFRNFGKYLIEFLWAPGRFDREFLEKNVTITGQEHLAGAYSRGRGMMVVTAHIGNWELGAGALSLLGYPVTGIALKHPHPRVNALFDEQRAAIGVRVVSTENAVRECLKDLRDKRALAIVADRDFHHRGYRMPFLSKTAEIPKGPAMFALKSLAPIVPAFFVRGEKPLTFRLEVHPPVYPEAFAGIEDEKERVEAIIRSYITVIEKAIRENPSQWLMFREYEHG